VGVAIYMPLFAALLLGGAAGRLARVLPPATATRALTAAAVLIAAATSFTLGVLAFTLLAMLGPVAALGRWSVTSLAAADPVPQLVAGAACTAVLLLGVSGSRAAASRLRSLAAARALCISLGGQPGQLVIVDDGAEDVFALPGDRGRIVASRSLLVALPADERRALLAHEAAHLHHHHHIYRAAAELAAAVNPLLRPAAAAIRYATERWADEEAAVATRDRATVAHALARAGLRRQTTQAGARGWRAVALDATDSAVVARVRALLSPPPRPQPAAMLALAALLLVTIGATIDAQQDAEQLFEQARPYPIGTSTVSPLAATVEPASSTLHAP
jgi:Zn-dependent protease with chaperone function